MQLSTFALTAAFVTVSFAAEAISQITDGQIQATTATTLSSEAAKSTVAAVSQITDGQIQASNSTATVAEANGAAKIGGSFAAAGLAAAALLL